MSRMRADFHMHTVLSDGACEPADLLQRIRDRGLLAFAVTDHDSLTVARRWRSEPGLVAGVEVTTWHEGSEVHVVGLGIDLDDGAFEAFLADIRAARHERMAQLRRHLARQGVLLGDDAGTRPWSETPSRSHLAADVVAAGYVRSMGSVFTQMLGDRHLRRLDPPAYPALDTAVTAIRAAGGVAILAHPAHYRDFALVDRLLAVGLDGIEVRHPRCSPQWQRWLERRASDRGLLRSCGSDFHAPGFKRPGDCRLPRAGLEALLERVGWRAPVGS